MNKKLIPLKTVILTESDREYLKDNAFLYLAEQRLRQIRSDKFSGKPVSLDLIGETIYCVANIAVGTNAVREGNNG